MLKVIENLGMKRIVRIGMDIGKRWKLMSKKKNLETYVTAKFFEVDSEGASIEPSSFLFPSCSGSLFHILKKLVVPNPGSLKSYSSAHFSHGFDWASIHYTKYSAKYPEKAIEEAKGLLKERFSVEKIILFGSKAMK